MDTIPNCTQHKDTPDYAELTAKFGEDVYDTPGATERYEFLSFLAPFVMVRRKSDNVKGTLQFRHHPRLYFGFVADK